MIIKELRLKNFGRFHNKEIQLKEGINLIYGENESGKSTLHSFIQGMLFGIEKPRGRASKEDWYAKYEPWDTPSLYNGSMDIIKEDRIYRMERDFNRFQKSASLIDVTTGRELPSDPESMIEFLGGLTESNYKNTISISQLKGKTEKELGESLRNYITNLSLTKTEIDVGKALTFLKTGKKSIKLDEIYTERKDLENKIKENLRIEDDIDKWTIGKENRLEELKSIKEKLDKTRVHWQERERERGLYESNPVIAELYKTHEEKEKKLEQLEIKHGIIEAEIENLEIAYENPVPLGLSIEQLGLIREEEDAINKEITLITKAREKREEKYRKRFLYILIPIICLIASIFFFYFSIWSTGALLLLLSCLSLSFLAYSLSRFKREVKYFVKEISTLTDSRNKLISKGKSILESQQAEDEKDIQERYKRTVLWEVEYKKKEALRRELLSECESLKEEVKVLEQNLREYSQKQREKEEREYNSLQEEYQVLLGELNRIEWELERYQNNEEELLWNEEKLKDIKKKEREEELKLKAIDIAIASIETISVDIHDNFGQELNRLVSSLMYHITGGKYGDIKVDEKLSVKIHTTDTLVDIEKLSVGTVEQLYLSLRLAVGDIMFKGHSLPLLLDDTFAYYDDFRTREALKMIHRERKGQVIIFTCHKREKVFLTEEGIPFHDIEL